MNVNPAAGFVITRYDADRMRSKVVGKPFATTDEAYARLKRLEASGHYRFPLMIDLASVYGLSANDNRKRPTVNEMLIERIKGVAATEMPDDDGHPCNPQNGAA